MHQYHANTFGFSSPYRFNAKEKDAETGLHYYGARYYQSKLSVWLSVDPLAHETLEPYVFTGNNPVMFIDPDGRSTWKPDGLGNLIAEANDNMETLSESLGISVEQATQLYYSQGNVYDEVCEGDVVNYDNSMSRDIANNGSKPNGIGENYNYNCYASSLIISQGGEIDATKDIWIDCPVDADNKLAESYKQINTGDLLSGETILRFGTENPQNHPHKYLPSSYKKCVSTDVKSPGGAQHYAVFHSISRNGTIHCYTKNGENAPRIMTLKALETKYGRCVGLNGGCGMYNVTR